MRSFTTFTLAALLAVTSAYDIPANLASLYSKHKSATCSNKLASGFNDGDTSDGKTWSYCGDIAGAIFLHSTGNSGQYDNLDIDCDGANDKSGACSNDPSGQGETAFKDTVKTYGISDLDANIHPYVVFGNEDSSPKFNPQDYGMKPLSVMAVVCNNQVYYGIWGDTNGGTATGEVALSLGKLCFPNENLSGDNGHSGEDVMYIGFIGSDAVPGKDGADWKAADTNTFRQSIKTLGNKLVAGLS